MRQLNDFFLTKHSYIFIRPHWCNEQTYKTVKNSWNSAFSTIDCLIRVGGWYVPKNNLFALLMFVYLSLLCLNLLPQPSIALTYLTWLIQWPNILKTDYQESVIEATILRNQAPSYSIFLSQIFTILKLLIWPLEMSLKTRNKFGNLKIFSAF